jgi:hypothetical protein
MTTPEDEFQGFLAHKMQRFNLCPPGMSLIWKQKYDMLWRTKHMDWKSGEHKLKSLQLMRNILSQTRNPPEEELGFEQEA